MSEVSSPVVVAEPARGSHASFNVDPLALFDKQSIGAEFRPHAPANSIDPRDSEYRRNDVILKTWRGVPSIKEENGDITSVRNGLASVRDFEMRAAANADRYFMIGLAAMTMIMAIIFAFFVASMNGQM